MPAGKARTVASRVELLALGSCRIAPLPPAPDRFTSWAIQAQFGKGTANNTERKYLAIIRVVHSR
jgi:hypothetical protein